MTASHPSPPPDRLLGGLFYIETLPQGGMGRGASTSSGDHVCNERARSTRRSRQLLKQQQQQQQQTNQQRFSVRFSHVLVVVFRKDWKRKKKKKERKKEKKRKEVRIKDRKKERKVWRFKIPYTGIAPGCCLHNRTVPHKELNLGELNLVQLNIHIQTTQPRQIVFLYKNEHYFINKAMGYLFAMHESLLVLVKRQNKEKSTCK